MRTILAGYTRVDPREIQFAYSSRGKPRLTPRRHATQLRFNLSHSEDIAVFAFAWQSEVGVDVECMREDVDMVGLAAHYFTPAEAGRIAALAPDERMLAFFATWTRKEAVIKARGDGLGMPLDSFEVSTDPLTAPRLLFMRSHPSETQPLALFDLQPGPGLAAALAVEGPVDCVREFIYCPGGESGGESGGADFEQSLQPGA